MDFNRDSFINGKLLLINKPINWTSFQVVNKIRWLIKSNYEIKKIKVGHAGTLDPLAQGLLIVCTGKLTKKIAKYQDKKKSYFGTFFIGATTPSFDLETEIDSTYSIKNIDKKKLILASKKFLGKSKQSPPIFSAIKLKGKKLYDYARKGENVKLEKREINIYKFELTNINLPLVDFEIECSKGTYIRSIANDFGKELKSGAYLQNLVRTSIGDYKLKDALSITDFEKMIIN
ncbi:MAG: tRNA pseudouridine(55) synthase TruB [Flavobacteriaceae bacterium]|nr:tRNA pseudouridine(55) synthase TruB [Flavobacteriaceae bacterium]